jgi:quinol monooxygenase YgiN
MIRQEDPLNTVTIFLKVASKKRDEFLQTIKALLKDLKQEKGFRKSSIYQDVNNLNEFHLVEEWETNDDLESYLKSEHFRIVLGTLKVLCQESEIRYRMVAEDLGKVVHRI